MKLYQYTFSLILTLFLSSNIYAQQKTVEVLYEYDMKYTGSSTGLSLNYQYVMDYLVESMNKNPDWKLHIRGHVCCGPDQKLSDKRAKNIYKYLLRQGIDPSRLSYKGYSDSIPLVFPEKTEEDAHQNRRVDFLITKPSK